MLFREASLCSGNFSSQHQSPIGLTLMRPKRRPFIILSILALVSLALLSNFAFLLENSPETAFSIGLPTFQEKWEASQGMFSGYTLGGLQFHPGALDPQRELWDHLGVKYVSFECDHGMYSARPCPWKEKRRFFEKYKDSELMSQIDVFYCSHPSAVCEYYLPFNRSMIIYELCRIQIGRHWENAYENPDKARSVWEDWVHTLQRLSHRDNVVIAVNNRYDVNYIKYFTGIDAIYVQMFDMGKKTPGSKWAPVSPTFLLGNHRVVPEKFLQNIVNPVIKTLNLQHGTNVAISRIRELYELPYTWGDIGRHRAIVIWPYQAAFEYYRLGIPLFLPSLKYYIHLSFTQAYMTERIYEFKTPPRLIPDDDGIPTPNDRTLETLTYWLPFSDWYTFPHIVYFDSPEDLYWKLRTTNFTHVHELMMEENERQQSEILTKWIEFLSRTLPKKPGGHAPPALGFNEAMINLWGLQPKDDDWCFSGEWETFKCAT